jgi:hypothetical protein
MDELDELLECDSCGWVGEHGELVSETSSLDDECKLCPDCGSFEISDWE